MKKILIGICGIGNGHLNRQICVINELKSKGFEVLAATSIDKVSVIKKKCNIEVLPIIIPWIVCDKNGVNFKDTLEKYCLSTQDRFKNFLEFSIAVEKYFNGKPDLVITDYEPNVAEYAYASNLKLITMEQQSKFLYLENIEINDFSINEEINRINYFFPKYDMKIISSFFPINIKKNNVVVVPPIINELEKRNKEDNKVLVYFSSYSFSIKYFEILNTIKEFNDYKFIVYTKENIDIFDFQLDKEDKKDIYLYINSPGGAVTSGLAIYDTIKFINSNVITIGMGLCASMGAFLLSSGDKRYALENTEIMIHEVLGGFEGSARNIKLQSERINKIKEKINKIMAKNTKKTIKQIEKDTGKDYYMSSKEAKEYGIIDDIIKK